MSDIDYIKHIQIFHHFDGTNSQFKCNISGLPSDNPPHLCKIKQVSFISAEPNSKLYALWSDLVNSNIVSFMGDVAICPDTTILLNGPIVGDIYFNLQSVNDNNELKTITDNDADIILNLEFIRYKK